MTSPPRSLLSLALGLAFALAWALAVPTADLAAQTTPAECDELVDRFTEAYLTNVYDDLGRLQQAVPALISDLRQEQPYTREQLDGMTTQQIKNNATVVQLQRDCLPRLIDLIRQIKNRIEQLEQLGSTSVQQNPRRTARGRLIDDVLTAQEELRDAVDDALRRAGISGD